MYEQYMSKGISSFKYMLYDNRVLPQKRMLDKSLLQNKATIYTRWHKIKSHTRWRQS